MLSIGATARLSAFSPREENSLALGALGALGVLGLVHKPHCSNGREGTCGVSIANTGNRLSARN